MQPGLPPAAPPATTLRQYPVCVLDWDMEWFDRRLLQQDMENGRARFRTLSNGLYRDLYKLRRHVQRHHLALAPPAVREEFPRYIDTAPERQYPVELLRPLVDNIQEMLRSTCGPAWTPTPTCSSTTSSTSLTGTASTGRTCWRRCRATHRLIDSPTSCGRRHCRTCWAIILFAMDVLCVRPSQIWHVPPKKYPITGHTHNIGAGITCCKMK